MDAPMIEELQHLWLDQLVCEFSSICFQYRLDLQAPIFELSDAEKQLGCWLPSQRTIRISRHLITEHPWEVVLMVLKHEMAHQVCSELLGRPEAGHDQYFQQACQMLGVPSPYNRSQGDLATVIIRDPEDQQTAKGRKIINRVNKLLSLAGSDNEHEAALAMQRATELLHRHNLEPQSAENDSCACSRLIINTRKKQIPTYRRAICGILRDYFFVQVIYSSIYDPLTDNSFKTIELLGRAENVPVAEHCYYFLEQQLSGLWQKNRHKFKGNTRTAKNSYYLGLLHGFSRKLAGQVKKKGKVEGWDIPSSSTAGALAIRTDTELQDFVGFHFPRLATHTMRGTKIYRQTYDEAVETGKTIVLHRTVADKTKGVQGLLQG
jgi:hypothetical protein